MQIITTDQIAGIVQALTTLPPPLMQARQLRIDEAAAELYDALRGAILLGHSLTSLSDAVLRPGGWEVSSERLRRALLALARKRRDRELASKIGGIRRRSKRAEASRQVKPKGVADKKVTAIGNIIPQPMD